ncbi:DUF4956 domain-containing protein, partial [Flavobacteriaceae bacterium]|nr:DUF4956 domain-containing protein [Flavobacteriaceae bacterium]
EWFWSLKHQMTRTITYDILENLKPENESVLMKDLLDKTGLQINKVSIGNVNFKRKRAEITIYYENK